MQFIILLSIWDHLGKSTYLYFCLISIGFDIQSLARFSSNQSAKILDHASRVMKRVRHEQINISVHHYLKRRQFLVSYSINQNLLNLKKNTKKVAFHQRSEKHIINAENHKTFHEHNNSPHLIKVTFFFRTMKVLKRRIRDGPKLLVIWQWTMPAMVR